MANGDIDTAYIFIGGLPFELTEGDILAIFSQYGEPTYLNLMRDKETGKSRGFGFLKYEDQRSTDLAVDNLGGASIMGRVVKVDHTRYKRKDGEEEADEERERGLRTVVGGEESEEESEKEQRPLLQEEIELQKLMRDHDEADPMKAYLVQEKKEEVAKAMARLGDGKKSGERKHKHHHRRHHQDKHEGRHRNKREEDDTREHRRHTKRRSRSP